MLYNNNIYLKRLTMLVSNAIPLEEVKSFLNIENTSQDDFLHTLLETATEYAEWYMERSLRVQTWQAQCDGYIPKRINLNFGPVSNIENIRSNINGSEVTLEDRDYKFSEFGSYIQFQNLTGIGQITITYTAGYEKQTDIPSPIREGILHRISSVYNNRNDLQTMSSIKQIYKSYRNFKITL